MYCGKDDEKNQMINQLCGEGFVPFPLSPSQRRLF